MDSLMGVELRLAIEGSLKVDLPLLSLADMTLSKVAMRLAASLVTETGAAGPAAEMVAEDDLASNPVLEALAARDRTGDRLIA